MGDNVAAGDAALVATGNRERHRRTGADRALESGFILGGDDHDRDRPGLVFLRDVVGEAVFGGIADDEGNCRRPACCRLADRGAMGRAEIGPAVVGQRDPENFFGGLAVADQRRRQTERRLVLGRPPEGRRLDLVGADEDRRPLDDVLATQHDRLKFDAKADRPKLTGDPVGRASVARRPEAVHAEGRVLRNVGEEPRSAEKIVGAPGRTAAHGHHPCHRPRILLILRTWRRRRGISLPASPHKRPQAALQRYPNRYPDRDLSAKHSC